MKHLAAWDKIQCFHFHFKISASRRTCFRFVLGHAVCQSLLPFDQRCNNQRRWSTLLRLQARESANLSCLGYDCRLPPGKYCGIVESLVSWKFWKFAPRCFLHLHISEPCFFTARLSVGAWQKVWGKRVRAPSNSHFRPSKLVVSKFGISFSRGPPFSGDMLVSREGIYFDIICADFCWPSFSRGG